MLDFSIPQLVRSESMFGTDPEVLQNCEGFTLQFSGSSSRRSNGFDTMHVACIDSLCFVCIHSHCVLDYYLLNSQL